MNDRSAEPSSACASTIRLAFGRHREAFRRTTSRARSSFEQRDWVRLRSDAAERLLLYRREVDACEREIRDLLGPRIEDRELWARAREHYAALIEGRFDGDLAETFFNSITRRVFTTVGVDGRVEFVGRAWTLPPAEESAVLAYGPSRSTPSLVEAVLDDRSWDAPWEDRRSDAAAVAARIDEHLAEHGLPGARRIELLRTVFYRGKGAYLVGHLHAGGRSMPLVFALRNGPEGIFVDAVLLHTDEVQSLFSFTRWYFQADTARPHEVVRFLEGVLPGERRSDLYISLGHIKHGKTELYRELQAHLQTSAERFCFAAGTPGLVMVVFGLPGLGNVFKVIRDRFPPQKEVTERIVRERYWLVHVHDRAGRLVDAQEFELLRFDAALFDADLLAELLSSCSRSVRREGDSVVVARAYVERKVVPLDVYVRTRSPEEVEAAVWDFGDALRDLAACGIFPGDILPKNFGVTGHGRVAFYDYDELALLPTLNFRDIPKARYDEDDMAAEPWFSVDPGDIFPEEFPKFFGLKPALRRVLYEHHAEIFTARWWRGVQQMLADGKVVEFAPYSPALRIGARPITKPTS